MATLYRHKKLLLKVIMESDKELFENAVNNFLVKHECAEDYEVLIDSSMQSFICFIKYWKWIK